MLVNKIINTERDTSQRMDNWRQTR